MLNLKDINKFIKIPMTFNDANEFCFTLLINTENEGKKSSNQETEEKYMVHTSQIYDIWVNAIIKNINYTKFWDKVKKNLVMFENK